MKRFVVFLLALLFLPFTVLAASAPAKIGSISVMGNERVERGLIMNVIQTKENTPFDMGTIHKDVERLYGTGFFRDIQVDVKDSDRGKAVTFVVFEEPVIRAIYVSGNRKVKTEDIRDALKIKTSSILNIKKMKESVDAVRKLYVGKGYYAVKVDYQVDDAETGGSEVRFVIVEPPKAFVRKIVFSGNEHLPAKRLKGVMKTGERGLFSWFTGSGIADEDVLEEDRRRIEELYHDNGYARVKVGMPEVTLSRDEKSVTVSFSLEEGKVFRFGSIHVKGDMIFDRKNLIGRLATKTGETFRSSLARKDALLLAGLYQEEGYAFVDVSPQTAIDDQKHEVSVDYSITKGPIAYIGKIHIIGNVNTRDKVIRRELRIAEGDRYSPHKIQESLRRLRNTGYFKHVDIRIEKTPG